MAPAPDVFRNRKEKFEPKNKQKTSRCTRKKDPDLVKLRYEKHGESSIRISGKKMVPATENTAMGETWFLLQGAASFRGMPH